jgi:hypothetical protein
MRLRLCRLQCMLRMEVLIQWQLHQSSSASIDFTVYCISLYSTLANLFPGFPFLNFCPAVFHVDLPEMRTQAGIFPSFLSFHFFASFTTVASIVLDVLPQRNCQKARPSQRLSGNFT